MFGKKKTPKEMGREWTSRLKSEKRKIEREIRGFDREEQVIERRIKTAAKQGASQKAIRTEATSLMQLRAGRDKLYTTATQINSVVLQLNEMQAQLRVAQIMQSSTQIMAGMGQLMNLPKISSVAREMSKEMQKAGLIQEMVDDSFAMLEDDDTDELADEAVDSVMFEITDGLFGKVDGIVGKPLPEKQAVEEEEETPQNKEMESMKKRLAQLTA
eukprot:153671_1